MLRLNRSPSTQLYLRSTVDTALQINRQVSTERYLADMRHGASVGSELSAS
jgi:hypothetical protein